MSVPITLPEGFVLVYGRGSTQSVSGIIPDNTSIRFGSIYQVWAGGEVFVYGGTSVMFNPDDAFCRLAWDGRPYTMIEYARLAGDDKLAP